MTPTPGSLFGAGLGVALATPLHDDGALDLPALAGLVRHVVTGGADFVVALGSTGEAATLDTDERDQVVATTLAHRGRAAVFVGAGASATAQAAVFATRAQQLGADGVLVVVPPYVKPTPAGIVAHFAGIGDAAPGLPVIAYNVPSRTGCNLRPETVAALWQLPHVVALKESSGDLLQIVRIAAALPPGRVLLAGDDALLLPSVAVGATGVISVAANVVPKRVAALLAAARAGALARAHELQRSLLPLFDALAAEPNPIPLKTALALAGLAGPTLRAPLTVAEPATRERLQRALHEAEVVAHA